MRYTHLSAAILSEGSNAEQRYMQTIQVTVIGAAVVMAAILTLLVVVIVRHRRNHNQGH